MTGQATVPPPAPAEAAPSEEEPTGRLARLAQLKRAEALGIDTTFGMDRADLAGDAAKLKAASGGGYDVVVDATGAAAVSERCVPLTRTDGLITHRFALDDYADALDALRGDRAVHKIIIECWQP
jgi:threonine dehydrogenase-like Zn-dependent dehydrogenase